jgi:hypothetical protein
MFQRLAEFDVGAWLEGNLQKPSLILLEEVQMIRTTKASVRPEFGLLSEAVQRWYHFYEVTPDDRVSETLYTAAMTVFGEGYKTADDIATVLIGTYVGVLSTRVNAISSISIH